MCKLLTEDCPGCSSSYYRCGCYFQDVVVAAIKIGGKPDYGSRLIKWISHTECQNRFLGLRNDAGGEKSVSGGAAVPCLQL